MFMTGVPSGADGIRQLVQPDSDIAVSLSPIFSSKEPIFYNLGTASRLSIGV